jgi:TonB-dependent starch-binding outer membrane protein SusC
MRRCQKTPHLRKIWMTMKLTMVIFFLAITNMMATEAYSQATKLTLQVKDATVREVLGKIEENSEFFFLYNGKLVDVDRKISLDVNDQKISEILSNMFRGTDVVYAVVDRQIVLTNKANQNGLAQLDSQQSQKVTGKVTNSSGVLLPGVSVVVKGTTNGTITDANGNYLLSNIPENATIQFSFVGMKTQEVAVGTRTTLDAVLTEEMLGLDEVVVIGYGTQRKVDLSGSVTVVSSKNIEKEPVADVLQALQGKAAGVEIISNSGQPGETSSIRIRGTQSWSASTSPIYVIDGVITGSMGSVTPDDIESVSVLKDASSTAIYGARAANGVVIITTKRGSNSGKPIISFHTYQGFQTESNLAKKFKLLNGAQYLKISKEFWQNDNPNPYNDLTLNLDSAYRGIDTDWRKLIRQTGRQQYYDLSASGGNDKSSYYTSLSYLTNTGMIKGQGQNKLSFRINLDNKLNKYIEFGNSLNLYHSTYYGWPDISGVGNPAISVSPNPYSRALEKTPLTRAYEADGSYGKTYYPDIEHKFIPPQAYINDCINQNSEYGIIGNVFLKVNILKGLSFTPRVSIDYNNFNSTQFMPEVIIDANTEQNSPNSIQKYNRYNLHWSSEYMLNYERKFKDVHNLSVLLMYSQEENTNENLRGLRKSVPNNQVPYLNTGAVDGMTNGNTFGDWSFISYVGRLNYNYNEKYLFQATVRRDGSSRFGINSRWGIFPSYSGAWRISKEKFFQNLTSIVNNLKLRASIGTTGNAEIALYPSYAIVSQTSYTLNNVIATGYTSSIPVNTKLQWETTKKYDVGIDASLIKSKLNFTADYYISRTSNMLYPKVLPLSAGKTENPIINGGEMENKGVELELGYLEEKGDFSYDININFTASHNKIIDIAGQNIRTDGNVMGMPVFSFFGMETNGIIKNTGALSNYPQHEFAELGDIWKMDINGDGKIDQDDRTIIGKRYPDFTYGLSSGVSYKRFSLQVSVMGVQGVDLSTQGLTLNYLATPQNQDTRILDRWNQTLNPNGKMPRIKKGDPSANMSDFSDFWLTDASYFRINNVNLKYSLPSSVCNKLQIKNLEVYGSIQNLYTFTRFSGPEVDVTGDAFGRIPQPRTWVIGFKSSF